MSATKNQKNDLNNDDEKEEVDKHRRDKADLEKVTDFHEDRDEMDELSKESLGKLKSADTSEVKKILIRKEDVDFFMEELELTKITAERYLFKHEGNVKAAVRDIVGF